ncbi:MAG: TPM domain-containing protein, partial [Candidatus Eremiobacterota bacterium]
MADQVKAGRKISRAEQAVFLVPLFLLMLALPAGAEIPPRPGGSYVVDFADVVELEPQRKLNETLEKLYREGSREVVIVTVPSMKRYVNTNSVETFAQQWYNRWNLASQDILLVISVGDRKARIHLGSQWGKRWNGHCQKVMNETLVPRFKAGDFEGGVLNGAEKLMDMVRLGPDARPPGYGWQQQLREQTDSLFALSDLRRDVAVALVGLGFALMIGGFVFSQSASTRIACAGAGILIIVIALVTVVFWLLLFLGLAILSPSRGYGYHHHHHSWGHS